MEGVNIVMRIVSSLIGLLMIAAGSAFSLQGLNLAFNGPVMEGAPSPMVGDPHWIVYGGILVLFGAGQVVWSNLRRTAR